MKTTSIVRGGVLMGKMFTEKTVKRDYIQILADIIKASRETSNMSKIMRHANVQYYTWGNCLETLCEKDFIEKIIIKQKYKNGSEKALYRATKKGLEWTKKVETLYDEIDHK
jgi:predicted transcriptional regulator